MKPDVLDKLDIDQTVDAYDALLGVPVRLIVSTDKATAVGRHPLGAPSFDRLSEPCDSGAGDRLSMAGRPGRSTLELPSLNFKEDKHV
ncbi:MAG: hypothetical protein EBY18_19810 [Alphaproteobacteria bacterium]|nr:hypothetical protein [Alphaproteobacteria bacterium]